MPLTNRFADISRRHDGLAFVSSLTLWHAGQKIIGHSARTRAHTEAEHLDAPQTGPWHERVRQVATAREAQARTLKSPRYNKLNFENREQDDIAATAQYSKDGVARTRASQRAG